MVATTLHHIGGQNTLLSLVLVLLRLSAEFTSHSGSQTYVQNEDEEVGLLALTAELLLGNLDILLELAHGVLEGCAGVIDLVHDQNVLADQVGHLEGAHVEPLGAGDLGAGNLLGIAATEILVEGETDGLDGDVGVAGALEEGSTRSVWSTCVGDLDIPKNAGRDVTTTADSDHQIGVEVLEDLFGRGLAQLVDLLIG